MRAAEFIVAVLSDVLKQRAYPDVLPEQAPEQLIYPAVVYQLMSSAPVNTLDRGAVACERRYQLDIYARTRKEARQAAAECVQLLTRDGRLVCLWQDDRDLFEAEVRRYRASVDVSIWEDVND
jgi:hypothetical protein